MFRLRVNARRVLTLGALVMAAARSLRTLVGGVINAISNRSDHHVNCSGAHACERGTVCGIIGRRESGGSLPAAAAESPRGALISRRGGQRRVQTRNKAAEGSEPGQEKTKKGGGVLPPSAKYQFGERDKTEPPKRSSTEGAGIVGGTLTWVRRNLLFPLLFHFRGSEARRAVVKRQCRSACQEDRHVGGPV